MADSDSASRQDFTRESTEALMEFDAAVPVQTQGPAQSGEQSAESVAESAAESAECK